MAEEAAAEIEITPQMIAAGVDAFRSHHFGEPEARIVEAIFLAMAIEAQASRSASAIISAK